MSDFPPYDKPSTRVVIMGFSTGADIATAGKQDEIKALLQSILDASPEQGQDTAANSLSVVIASDQTPLPLAASELHLGEVGTKLVPVTRTFARPNNTSPYIANDVVSNDTGASTLMAFADLVRVNGGSGYIVGARLATNKKSLTARWRVHVFNDANPTRAVDNGPFISVFADYTKRVAVFDLPAMTTPADTANSDMSSTYDFNLRVPIVAAAGSTTLHVLLEILDGLTPDALEQFALTLFADDN